MNKLLLKDKVAIVTGASKGIGYAISDLFAQEGCRVIMIARNRETLQKSVDTINGAGYPGGAVALPGDVVDESLSQRAFELALSKFGRVDIVINNAGLGETVTIDTTSTEHWDTFMNLNLRSAFFFCREAGKHFAKTGEGVVINISSINGVKPGSGVTYCTAKGALNTMTRNMAVRFAGTRVRVNAISPGMTDTEQTLNPNAGGAFDNSPYYEGAENMRQYGNQYVNNEIDGHVPPIQQAYAALFLASEMGECITGQNLVVEKGRYFV